MLDDADVHALGLTPDGEGALRTLASANAFGGWAVSAAGTPTPGIAALRVLGKETSAAKAFALVRSSSRRGRSTGS